ncbi:SAM-dependent methyltransferase [Streptomyces sp. NPDC017405]|uniref:SAM-dependent methyltransferase n=1 Tax=unclassified Streptomyces TaxID=2593676 RepID=UPI00379AA97D
MTANQPEVRVLAGPCVARVYNYLDGGVDHYPDDRALARQLLEVAPWLPQMVQTDSAYRPRAVDVIARELGITQFVDLGCGLPPALSGKRQGPGPQPVYEVARRVHDAPRVVYVDSDWMVAAHAKVMLDTYSGTAAVRADIREIDRVLGHPDIAGLHGAPTAWLLHDLLAWWDDAAAGRVLSRLREWSPPGSAISITHVTGERSPEAMRELPGRYAAAGIHYQPRSLREITDLLGPAAPWELLEPGIVPAGQWGVTAVADLPHIHSYAAVITKRPVVPSPVKRARDDRAGPDLDPAA